MTTAILMALVTSVVPALVHEAEHMFGADSGEKKRQWVIDGVHAAIMALEKHVPNWADALLDGTEPLIDAAIEFALDKADVK